MTRQRFMSCKYIMKLYKINTVMYTNYSLESVQKVDSRDQNKHKTIARGLFTIYKETQI